jgi:transposase
LPKRWIVECTIAWLNPCRRLAKDRDCLNRKALAFLRLASIRLLLRKLCQKKSMIPDEKNGGPE